MVAACLPDVAQALGLNMRIVMVISSLIYGGAETQAIALGRELARRGHAVSIYTLGKENPRLPELDASGVEVVEDQKRGKLDFGIIRRLRQHLSRYRADLVHGYLYDGNLYASIAAACSGIPALVSERNDDYALNFNQRVGLLAFRPFVTGLVANSHAGADFARRMFRLPDDRIHVVWNGIDIATARQNAAASQIDIKHEFFQDPGVRIACLVGTLRLSKDFMLAVEVAKSLIRTDSGWRILFVGGPAPEAPEYFDQVRYAARDLVAAGRCHFAGLRKDVLEVVSQCEALFSTSRYEGFPNVVLEAMAVGTPVVSTEYSDIRLILPEPWQVVPGRRPADIAQAILRADRERERLAAAQCAWVEANATIGRAADALLDVYRRYADAEESRSEQLTKGHEGERT